MFCHILTQLENLENQLNIEKERYESLKLDFDDNLRKIINKQESLNYDVDNIFDELYSMDCRIIHVEQYTRRESVVISGIPDSIKQENLEHVVLDILHRIGLEDVSFYQISACHRLYKKKGDKYPAKTIVRFTNRKIAEFCFRNSVRLVEVGRYLEMNLRFFASLCKTNEKILKTCKKLHKYDLIAEFKVINGTSRIIKKDDHKYYKIHHPEELYELFLEFWEYEDIYMS